MTETDPPVLGELWTDHPRLPHGTREQITAWLLVPWNPRLVRITATNQSHGVKTGMVAYAKFVDADGLGREHVMEVEQFMRSFQRIPDNPPEPWDIPPEVSR